MLLSCLPVVAQDQKGWQFDSLRADPGVSNPKCRQVYEALDNMYSRWNAHDLEGDLDAYWKSPELLVIIDSEQYNGWDQLHKFYVNGYPDKNDMGNIKPKRIQIRLLEPDLALVLTWWSVSFRNSTMTVVGNTTINLEKFDDGWKIVTAHTSTSEM